MEDHPINCHHQLKTHPAMYFAAKRGDKTFEVRKDDRAYQRGDVVTLLYHDPDSIDGAYAYQEPLTFVIGFVLRGGQYGVEPGYVAFSLHRHPEE